MTESFDWKELTLDALPKLNRILAPHKLALKAVVDGVFSIELEAVSLGRFFPISEPAKMFLEAVKKFPLSGAIMLYPDREDFNQKALAMMGKELTCAGLATMRKLEGSDCVVLELIEE